MIEFKLLTIENFMSMGEAEVDLSTGGFTLISAINNRVEDASQSNGAGKSTISEAITWCLTGETLRGHKEVVNRYTEGDCKVKLSFDFKGSNWAIERSMTRDKEKSLLIIKDGQELKSKGYRDAQEVLARELPELTFKFINSVIILGQGLPGRFTNNTPAGRKAVLEELTNADYMITQIKDNIKRRQEILTSDLRTKEDNRLKLETQIQLEQSQVSDEVNKLELIKKTDLKLIEEEKIKLEAELSNSGKELSELDKNSDKLNQKIEGVSKKSEELTKNSLEEVNKLNTLLSENKSRIVKEFSIEKEKALAVLSERITKGKKLIETTEEAISHNRALISGGVCRLCGQRLSSVSEEDLQKAKNELEVNSNNLIKYKELLQSLIDQSGEISENLEVNEKEATSKEEFLIGDQIANIEAKYKTEVKEYVTKKETLTLDLKNLKSRQNILSDKIYNLKFKIVNKETEIKNYFNKVKELENSIETHKNSIIEKSILLGNSENQIEEVKDRLSVVKQMETFASRDFRGILLENVIFRLNTLIGNYAQSVYGNRLTNFYLEGNAIQVEFDGKEYESLSGGEKQKLDVILQLSLRDLIIELTGVTGSILFLDEVFDGLDSLGCEKMIDLFQSIETSVYIISHHKELNIPYDYILTVVKESNGVSYVQKGE